MDRRRCKVCFRDFTNGSALGGHMRSHMMNFHVSKLERDHQAPAKMDDLRSFESYSSISSQYLSQEDDGTDEEKGLNPEFSSVMIQDTESDTDSWGDHSICRRSKRVRDSRTSEFARFEMRGFLGFKKSKFSDEAKKSCAAVTPEEDVAYSLMMLSRDKRVRDIESEVNFRGEKCKFGDDFFGDSDVSKVRKDKVGGRYRCETCNKMFRSYQALGGHMASHKKMRHIPFNNEHASSSEMADSGGGSAVVEEKVHECPFCQRVFSSGQALGGHKRSHFARGGGISRNINYVRPAGSPVESMTRTGDQNLKNIDLNLPTPALGDEDGMSQIAVSAVFDA